MPTSVSLFVSVLRENQLLEPHLLEKISRSSLVRGTDPRAVAKELVQRNWPTPYQANQFIQGRAD